MLAVIAWFKSDISIALTEIGASDVQKVDYKRETTLPVDSSSETVVETLFTLLSIRQGKAELK